MRLARTRRFAALSVLTLWLAAPLLALSHAGDEGHSYCVEHATFEEQGGSTADGVGPARFASTHDHDRATRGAADHEGDDHTACAFASSLRDERATARMAAPTYGPAPSAPAAQAPACPGALLAPIPLLALAPKSSPPRA